MSKFAAIGKKETVKIFNITGAEEVYVETDEKKVEKIIDDLSKRDFAIIFVEEEIFKKITKTIEKYKTKNIPSICAIPSTKEDDGLDIINLTIKKIVGNEINI